MDLSQHFSRKKKNEERKERQKKEEKELPVCHRRYTITQEITIFKTLPQP